MAARSKRGKSRGNPRDKRKKKNGNYLGSILIAFSICVFGAGAWYLFQAKSSAVSLDPETLCPISGGRESPSGLLVMLIDTSDVLDAVERKIVADELVEAAKNTPVGWQVSVYHLSEQVTDLPQPLLSKCNPGSGADISEWDGNPTLIQRQWEGSFVEPLQSLLAVAVSGSEARTSPIMENLRVIAAGQLSTPSARKLPRKLVILSDMLQNSDVLSQYRKLPPFGEFRKSAGYSAVWVDLSGVEITVFYLDRSAKAGIDRMDHVEFWSEFFSSLGADLARVRKISG